MPASDYVSHGGGGALKLKGSAGVDKKQRKKKKKRVEDSNDNDNNNNNNNTDKGDNGARKTVLGVEDEKNGSGNVAKEHGSISNDAVDVGIDIDDPASKHDLNDGNADAHANASALQKRKEKTDAVTPSMSSASGKTEAQLRYEERRRRRLEERLRREGVKTHKERVEELNRYLSNLSEHHDMYVKKNLLAI